MRGLILAFTGDRAAAVLDEEPEATDSSAAAVALQALDRQVGEGWQVMWLPVAAYQVVRGAGF